MGFLEVLQTIAPYMPDINSYQGIIVYALIAIVISTIIGIVTSLLDHYFGGESQPAGIDRKKLEERRKKRSIEAEKLLKKTT